MPLHTYQKNKRELLIDVLSCEGVIEKNSWQYFKNVSSLLYKAVFLLVAFFVNISTPSSFTDDRTSVNV